MFITVSVPDTCLHSRFLSKKVFLFVKKQEHFCLSVIYLRNIGRLQLGISKTVYNCLNLCPLFAKRTVRLRECLVADDVVPVK